MTTKPQPQSQPILGFVPHAPVTLFVDGLPAVTFEFEDGKCTRDPAVTTERLVKEFWHCTPKTDEIAIPFRTWSAPDARHVVMSPTGVRFDNGYAPDPSSRAIWEAIAAAWPKSA
jgi:hypothetical protein